MDSLILRIKPISLGGLQQEPFSAMKLFFAFNLQSHTLLCHEVAKNIRAADPDSRFAGVMTVKGGPHEKWLRSQTEIPYEMLDSTDDIEKRALNYEVSTERIIEWERRFDRPLFDLIIADRNIGHRYVTDGRLIRTDMMAHDSHGDLSRFVCCFLDTFEDHLRRFKPDLVFMPAVASMPALALVRVCAWMGIPFTVLRSARIGNRFVLSLNDSTERFFAIEAAFEKACKDGGPLPQLPAEFKTYLDSYKTDSPEAPFWATTCNQAIEKLQKTSPFRFYGDLLLRLGLACKRKLFLPSVRDLRWKHPFSILGFQIRQKMAVRHFRPDRFDEPQDAEPYIYFPLHLSPEASTMVLAPDFSDQLAVIDRLATHIPLSHKLYVKEHPTMIGLRPTGFYERIRRHANVRLINPLTDSMALSRRADLVAVITGTVGWEAILMGRPVLMLGESFFSHLGFCHRGSDPAALGALIKDIIFHEHKPLHSQDELSRYLKCLYDGSFELPDGIQVLWGRLIKPGQLNDEERLAALVLARQLLKAVADL